MWEEGRIETAIKKIADNLSKRKKLSNFDLLDICKENGIGGIAGKNDTHFAHEIMEVAVNIFISQECFRKFRLEKNESSEILNEIIALENQIPVEGWRSEGQQKFQQFSTPPTIAFLMAKILNPIETDLILEPSAGTGSLAAWLKIVGCKIHLNELSERRRALLKLQGYQPTAYNAEFLDDLLPEEILPEGVLMNPPFSSSGGRAKNNDSNFGFRHVKAALARLKNGGRLVALLGSGTLTKTDKGRGFLSELAAEYELKAVINLPKNAFYKYGTTVQTSIICIRKSEIKLPATQIIAVKDVSIVNCQNLEEVLCHTGVFD